MQFVVCRVLGLLCTLCNVRDLNLQLRAAFFILFPSIAVGLAKISLLSQNNWNQIAQFLIFSILVISFRFSFNVPLYHDSWILIFFKLSSHVSSSLHNFFKFPYTSNLSSSWFSFPQPSFPKFEHELKMKISVNSMETFWVMEAKSILQRSRDSLVGSSLCWFHFSADAHQLFSYVWMMLERRAKNPCFSLRFLYLLILCH